MTPIKQVYPNFLEPGNEHYVNIRFGIAQVSFEYILLKISSYSQMPLKCVAEIGAGACHHIIDSARFFDCPHFAFEPAPDMFSQGKANIENSGLKNIRIIQKSIEDIPLEQFGSSFGLTISCMVMHFTSDLKKYLGKLRELGSDDSLHLVVDFTMPDGLTEPEKDAIRYYFSEVISLKIPPLPLACLKKMFLSCGFDIVDAPANVEILAEDSAKKYFESMPTDRIALIKEVASKFDVSELLFCRYRLANSFILKKSDVSNIDRI